MHSVFSAERFLPAQARAHDATMTEQDVLLLESSVRTALENMAAYQLVSATPTQMQDYFFFLEAYAHDLSMQPLGARYQLVQEAWQLCQALTRTATLE
ncbi:hypothetical protein [Hymenobacter pini]|uniref:hypothetical protein n=1 Tax=Hymenobacter pini TaxID=2880879 RepID=UPI001CF5FA17|nr:hypothetical protein [Hymenobacter pini]MCA8829399.1 hypothetical protein [Hymenobacter pini]